MLKHVFLLSLACLVFHPAAHAAVPSIEELHKIVMLQQQQLQQQSDRIHALEQGFVSQQDMISTQKDTILTQAARFSAQEQTIDNLERRAEKAESELERVKATFALAKAGPAALPSPTSAPISQPAISPVPEKQQPFTLSADVEYLIAHSKSFKYISSEDSRKDNGDEERNFGPGFMIGLTHEAQSGLTWGAAFHYWSEARHTQTSRSVDSTINLGPDAVDANNVDADVDAERFYADLYVQNTFRESDALRLDLHGGLRAGSFSQNIFAKSLDNPGRGADSSTSFLGFGPMVGLAADSTVMDRLGLLAYGDVAVLVGTSETNVSSVSGGGQWTREHSAPLDVAWMFNSRLGMDYAMPLYGSDLTFEFGLNTEYWTGLPDHIRYSDDVDEVVNYNDTDVLLIGPYFEMMYEF